MQWNPDQLKKPFFTAFIIGLVSGLIVIGFQITGKLQFLEFFLYDEYISLDPSLKTSDNRIVLVEIKEKDIGLQKKWPFPDEMLADVLKKILADAPRVIGLDIYRDYPVPPGSEALEKLFASFPLIVTVTKMSDDMSSGVPPPFMVNENHYIGFNDILVDHDGVVRKGLLFMDRDGIVHNSLALLLSLLYLEKEGIRAEPDPYHPERMKLGKTTFKPLESNDGAYVGADSRGYQFLLDFKGAKSNLNRISFSNVLSGNFGKNFFRDRIVIIGSTADSLKDFFFVPFELNPTQGNRISGPELHASITTQLIHAAMDGKGARTGIPEGLEWAWVLFWAFLGSIAGTYIRSFKGFFSFIALFIPGITALTLILFFRGIWVPLGLPVISIVLSIFLATSVVSYRERQERGLLMRMFASHVSRDVAEAMWEQRDFFMEGGRPLPRGLKATVLFADLKGFTSISEKMDPEALMNWMNELMEEMVREIIDHHGIVNKFIGDAVMAVFGIPIARTNEEEIKKDAINAVSCAISMGNALGRLNTAWKKRNLPLVKMRIGICTGRLVVGSIGGINRQEYTVLGDTVNTASRLESYDKSLFSESLCRILVNEETKQYIEDQFETQTLTDITLKGKKEKMTIFRVVCSPSENRPKN